MAQKQVGRSICSNAALRRATRQLGQLYDDVIGPSGLKATQFGLLYQVTTMDHPTLRAWRAGDGSVSVGAYAEAAHRGWIGDARPRSARPAGQACGAHGPWVGEGRGGVQVLGQAHVRFERVVGAAKAARLRHTLDWIASPEFADAFTGS